MAKYGKKYLEAAKLIDSSKSYSVSEALELAQKIQNAHELVATCPGTSYQEEYFTYSIENSNGLSVKKSGGFAYLVGQVVIKKGEEVKSGFDVQIAKKFADFD